MEIPSAPARPNRRTPFPKTIMGKDSRFGLPSGLTEDELQAQIYLCRVLAMEDHTEESIWDAWEGAAIELHQEGMPWEEVRSCLLEMLREEIPEMLKREPSDPKGREIRKKILDYLNYPSMASMMETMARYKHEGSPWYTFCRSLLVSGDPKMALFYANEAGLKGDEP